jgi:two-component system, OmpR family, KDP operon response regulator KdpE
LMNKAEKKPRVLVVDDQSKVLKFVEIGLKLRGFEVLCASCGEEALELVVSVSPDIMILDIVMPGMDGFEVLKKLRTFTQLPVIAFSASPGNRDSILQSGANDFMPKPFDPNVMTGRIRALLPH